MSAGKKTRRRRRREVQQGEEGVIVLPSGWVTPDELSGVANYPPEALRSAAWRGEIEHEFCCEEHGTLIELGSALLWLLEQGHVEVLKELAA